MKRISTEWKQKFSVTDFDTHSEFKSLFDLLFIEKDELVYSRLNFTKPITDHKCEGLKLSHSMICFDEDCYDNNGRIKPSTNDININELWKTNGFDVALPKKDLRVKPIFLSSKTFNKFIEVDDGSLEQFLQKYKPRELSSADYYYDGQSGFASGIKIFDKESLMSYYSVEEFINNSIYENKPTVTTEDNYSLNNNDEHVRNLVDIILCEEDFSFKEKFLTDINKRAFTKICINPTNDKIWKYFCKYYDLQYRGSFNYKNFIEINQDSTVEITETMKFLLKNCFFLVRAPFFADIIDYKDFGQSLNKNSKVIHNNLILTKNGDFNRFNKFSDSEKESTLKTRPYFPRTTPSVDLLTQDILKSLEVENKTFNEKIQAIIDESEKQESIIGAIPTETFESLSNDVSPSFTSKGVSSPLPLWFEPESRKAPEDYKDLPILFGKDGNIIVDGRIISRTIDELWVAIKTLQSGRASDLEIESSTEVGYPFGEGQLLSEVDTRPSIKNHGFKYENKDKIGDPVLMSYKDEESLTFKVDSWVNNPNKIKYAILSSFKLLEQSLTTESDTPDLVCGVINTIKNLPEKYLPASKPYSLRELEALLRGLQYNLEAFISYTSQYYAKAGSVGERIGEGPIKAAGSVYTLHKDYGKDNFKDTQYKGTESLSPITDDVVSEDQNIAPSYTVYMGADGQWHSVWQCINIRIRDDEEF